MASEEYVGKKIAELRAFAAEYENYSSKMPSDPFALRWRIIAEALLFQAEALAAAAPLGAGEFLVRRGKPSARAHLWIGDDTACHMWSTGGLVKSHYEHVSAPGDRRICQMCQHNSEASSIGRTPDSQSGEAGSTPAVSTVP